SSDLRAWPRSSFRPCPWRSAAPRPPCCRAWAHWPHRCCGTRYRRSCRAFRRSSGSRHRWPSTGRAAGPGTERSRSRSSTFFYLLSRDGLLGHPGYRGLFLGGAGGGNLLHQVVVPLAFDLHVTGSAQFKGLDEVVVDVGVDAGLLEGVERRTGRTARDEPGFQIAFGPVDELARGPDVVAMAADQVGPGVAVGRGMDEQHGLAHLGRQGAFTGERALLAVEHDVRRDQAAHHFGGIAGAFQGSVVFLVIAVLILRDVQVELTDG